MYLHSGYIYIEGTNEQADYEFEHEEQLDGMEQLEYLLSSGMLQIIDGLVERI